jgi:hypothetical protein
MRRVRFLVLTAGILLASVAVVRADTIPTTDPQIIISQGIDSTTVGLTFTGSTDQNGFFQDFFINGSGMLWFNLQLALDSTPPLNTITCISLVSFFSNCMVAQMNGQTFALFTGGTGLPNGSHFELTVNQWDPNTPFTGTANVPEPGTLTLVLTGVAALASRRRTKGPRPGVYPGSISETFAQVTGWLA